MEILITKHGLAKELNKDVRGLRDIKATHALRMGKKLVPLFDLPKKN